VYELFQALVGVVLADYDDCDALLLNAFTSHATHAITRGLNTQVITRAIAPAQEAFAFQSLLSIIRSMLPNEQS
jgi:hypothetical protein